MGGMADGKVGYLGGSLGGGSFPLLGGMPFALRHSSARAIDTIPTPLQTSQTSPTTATPEHEGQSVKVSLSRRNLSMFGVNGGINTENTSQWPWRRSQSHAATSGCRVQPPQHHRPGCRALT
jgi:hypothetical protein